MKTKTSRFTVSLRFIFTLFLTFNLSLLGSTDSTFLKKKIAQLLICHFHGTHYNKDAEHLIKNLKIGGVIFYSFSNPFQDAETVQALTNELQNQSELPLLICVDQEGAPVLRLTNGYSTIPSAFAMSQNPSLIKTIAQQSAEELSHSGINLNLSPVIDITNEELNCSINTRAFGSNCESVIKNARHWLEGTKPFPILSTLKHFPGHGQTAIDSHMGLPTTSLHSCSFQEQFFAFLELSKICPLIMTSHMIVKELDEKNPLTLSPITLPTLAKFFPKETLWISDSLAMKAISLFIPDIADAAIQTLLAGHDLIILGGKQLLEHEGDLELNLADFSRVIDKMTDEAIRNPKLKARIEESYIKVLHYKSLIDKPLLKSFLISDENALTCAKNNLKIFGDLNAQHQAIDTILAPRVLEPLLSQLTNKTIHYFSSQNLSSRESEELCSRIQPQSSIIFFSHDEKRFTNQLDLITKLKENNSLILVQTKIPLTLQDCDLLLQLASPDKAALQNAIELLREKFGCQI